ncbi:type 1 glutamine amidotransferase [Geobacter argillaceus]|nr:type 1 glutamine amidotransferase [Geobacter argillaceus]
MARLDGWVERNKEKSMVLVVQNDPEVPVGSYGEQLDDANVPWRLVRAYAGEPLPEPGELAAAIVLGGAMGVYDTAKYPFLSTVREFMDVSVRADLPLLGICLGGQLLADLCGAVVSSGQWGEKGVHGVTLTDAGGRDPLFTGIPREFLSFQWHNDSFALPAGSVLLASSLACPNQAFRIGHHVYGLQFHPEVTSAIVAAWAGKTRATSSRWEEYVAEFTKHGPAYRPAAARLLANFLSLARKVC